MTPALRRATLHRALLSCLLLAAGMANADDATTGAEAQRLFDEGRALLARGQAKPACARFEESQRLEAGLGTQLNLASCYAALGKLASAHALFIDAASRAAAQGQVTRARVARQHAQALVPRLSHLTIIVPQELADGLQVERNGVRVERDQWGVAVAVDAGVHRVRARGPRRVEWWRDIDVPAEAARRSLSIPVGEPSSSMLERARLRGVGSPARVVPVDSAALGSAEPSTPGFLDPTHRKIGLVFASLGVVSLGTATYFGVRALDEKRESNAGCRVNTCFTQAGLDARQRARSSGNAATLAVGAGVIGLALGTLIMAWSSEGPARETAWAILPKATGERAELSLERSF